MMHRIRPWTVSLRPGAGRRGFYMIGLLLALVIIFILAGNQYYGSSNLNQVPQAQLYIQRSTDTLCTTNRLAIRTDIAGMLALDGVLPTEEQLAIKLYSKLCPERAAFQITERGEVFCETHAPAPEGTKIVRTVKP